jgi:hypothetical protein
MAPILPSIIGNALAREGLSYGRGGYIHGAALSGPSRSLADRIKSDGIRAIEIEYDRAYKSIESDPGSAVTAACGQDVWQPRAIAYRELVCSALHHLR